MDLDRHHFINDLMEGDYYLDRLLIMVILCERIIDSDRHHIKVKDDLMRGD